MPCRDCRTRDVGIAIGGGTNSAIESAGLILVNSNPLDVVKIFRLSRASYNKTIRNLWWAAGYNVFAIPLAAGVLASWGILLSPAVDALLIITGHHFSASMKNLLCIK